jgi:hypothetical protein
LYFQLVEWSVFISFDKKRNKSFLRQNIEKLLIAKGRVVNANVIFGTGFEC